MRLREPFSSLASSGAVKRAETSSSSSPVPVVPEPSVPAYSHSQPLSKMRPARVLTLALGALSIYSVSAKHIQKPIMDNLGPAMPPEAADPPSSTPTDGDAVILCDVLGRDRSINIFAGFTRDIDTIDQRLSDGSLNTTVLAPLNSAIVGLPRKPWESNDDYKRLGADAYEGKPGEDRAHANLRRFVEEHVVPESPWEEGTKMATLAGSVVWWEMKDGKRIVQPGNIEVQNVASRVANGQVWILKGARNYA